MKIGIGINSIFPQKQNRIDGIGVYTKQIIKELQNQSVELQKILLKGLFTKHKSLLTLPNPYLLDLLPIRFTYDISDKIDIYHSTDYHIPYLKNSITIATLHDAIKLKNPKFSKGNLHFLKNYLLKKHIKYADHIIAISHSIIPDLVNFWGVDENKITVIYNGIDPSWRLKYSEEEIIDLKKKYSISSNYFLSVGTLQPRKNFARIIKAYQSLPKDLKSDIKLIIVGKRGWKCDEEIYLLKDLNIKWLEYIPLLDLQKLYQGSLGLIFPSLEEGFGLPILEGFASQIPVVTSNISSMPEIAADAAIYVDPYSIEAIKESMQKILDSKLRKKLISKGNRRVLEFGWDKTALNLIKLYKQLLS